MYSAVESQFQLACILRKSRNNLLREIGYWINVAFGPYNFEEVFDQLPMHPLGQLGQHRRGLAIILALLEGGLVVAEGRKASSLARRGVGNWESEIASNVRYRFGHHFGSSLANFRGGYAAHLRPPLVLGHLEERA
jgi:hypothetical protein